MKSIIATLRLLALIATLIAIGSTAEARAHTGADSASVRTDTIQVHDMRCGQCESRIHRAFKSVNGVSDMYADVETGTAVVTYDPKLITQDAIKAIIVKTGYGVDKTPGDPKARKALPGCCK